MRNAFANALREAETPVTAFRVDREHPPPPTHTWKPGDLAPDRNRVTGPKGASLRRVDARQSSLNSGSRT